MCALVISSPFPGRYTFPGKINVYSNEAYVPPKGRANRVTALAEPGANYMNPGSRVLRFTVKTDSPDDEIKLKLLEVVEVSLVVAETFESFFADNNVDPAALHPDLQVRGREREKTCLSLC